MVASCNAKSTKGTVVVAVVLKAIFITSMILQVVLWPSAVTICFACIYAVSEMNTWFFTPRRDMLGAFLKGGPIIFRRGGDSKLYEFTFMVVMAIYFGSYFGLFVGHEMEIQPAATFWLPPALMGNYTMAPDRSTPLPVDVTSSQSSEMRQHGFVWHKHVRTPAPPVVGTVQGAGPAGGALSCVAPSTGNGSAAYSCFAKLLYARPPTDNSEYSQHQFAPLAEPFYHTDVRVSPPKGTNCKDLEVYRIVLDHNRNVLHGMDYPSSITPSSAHWQGAGGSYAATCGLFGSPSWCLQLSHPFTDLQYRQEVAARCAKNGEALVFKLPNRAPDIDYDSGKMSTDIIVASRGATVELHAGWHHMDSSYYGWFWSPWRQVVYDDAAQGFRESHSDAQVMFKFAVSITPVLIVWYYLTVGFQDVVGGESQVLLLCLFVLLPAVGMFLRLSIGAWVPMGGCLVCLIAVNHDRKTSTYTRNRASRIVVPALLFITAVCNSIEIAWLIALIVKGGYSAFFYEVTLDQLYTLSDRFIISNGASPTWTTLFLPCTLVLNGVFMLGAGICVVLELLFKHKYAAWAA